MSLCTIRLRGPAGVSTIQLAPTATLLELRASILSATDILPERQQLRTGIPPRPLDISTGDQTSLEELGIRSGDVIVVQEGQGHAIPPSSSSGQSAVQSHATTVGPSPLSTNSAATASKPSSMADTPKAHSAQATPRVTASSDGLLQPVPLRPVAKNTSNLTSSPSKSEIAAAQPARNSRPQQPQSPPFSGATASGAKPGLTSIEGASIKVDGGWMVLRVVPDDNSCMFTALSIVLEHGKPGMPQKLREVVAEQIRKDPFKWSDAVLGMSPSSYCDRIVKRNTWGGAIELAILSEVYQTEIDSIDVQTGRSDRFGEEHEYPNRVLLIYSGIHYDAITFTPLEPNASDSYPYNLDFDQTIFSRDSDGYALAAAIDLSQKLQRKHYYTDTAGFSLRCEICKTALKGEKEAQRHAQETGHTTFGEY